MVDPAGAPAYVKGNQVNIPEPGHGYLVSFRRGLGDGNVNELSDTGESPRKSSLFFLTRVD